MNFSVDTNKALKKWGSILDTLQVNDPDKREWIATYAEMHQINENVGYSTLGNLNGMGNVVAAQPGAPGSVWGAGAGSIGSGDVGQNLLPISMKIAAQTIGLDLVAIKPTASPKVDLLFVDFKYDNNYNTDSRFGDVDKEDKPLIFKLTVSQAVVDALKLELTSGSIQETVGGLSKRCFVYLSGATAGINYAASQAPTNALLLSQDPTLTNGKQAWMEFLGFSRIDGKPIFRIFRQVTTPPAMNTEYTDAKNTFTKDAVALTTIFSGATLVTASGTGTTTTSLEVSGVELVSLMEDQIPGFSTGWYSNSMTRLQDETTYPGVIGPDLFTKSVPVGDIEITSALKRTQIEDIKASTGMDIVQKLESVLINELTQVISKQIVAKVKELGETNRVSYTTPKVGTVSKFDFDVDAYLGGSVPGGETSHSMQRKLVSKINYASNFIATEGRVGPAEYLVTNGTLASVIQDIAGYTINPVQGAKMNTNGQLYPMGQIGAIKIYVDPYQRFDDNKLYLGRKNTVDQPGLIFAPYLMAQSIQIISEATFAPRMMIRSRYAIIDAGFFPEKQFMAIHIKDTNGVLI